jgi:hypothetical protein
MLCRVFSLKWPIAFWVLALLLGARSSFGNEPAVPNGDWPFAPPERPALPEVHNASWVANAIDRFILCGLEKAGIKPNGEADKSTLLRRATFDLTGLPPTVAELDAFLADGSPQAYEHVVDRLLASPRFGERAAQYWLDLVRYADTEGFRTDALRENAFRYRDYVIDSFNSDLPFDDFVRQQIAGDEIEPDNPQAQVATGFLRLYPEEDNAADLFQQRQQILDDVTDTTSLVFLGLTMGCAQCHDHKFDDIPQADYYRLQAFFASMTERDDLPIADPAQVAAYEAARARWEKATEDVRAEMAALLEPIKAERTKFYLEKFEPTILACYAKPASARSPLDQEIAETIQRFLKRKFVEEDPGKRLSTSNKAKFAALKKELARFDSIKPKPIATAMTVSDVGASAPVTHLLGGGSWKRPEAVLEPGFPKLFGAGAPGKISLVNVHKQTATTGRRTQLAYWLTRPDHPLTARVIVNRLWQQHFGRGLVATPNDFGLQGDRPTHPELLDWLAVELVENGWSLKHIHRLMVTSATYRTASIVDVADSNVVKATHADRENRLLWHANRRRLEGEGIRDAMLQTAGELNLAMHGPSVRPELPAGVSQRYAWKPEATAAERNRRSIYLLTKRNLRYPLFEAFDQPDLHQSCPRRAATITAPQSLAMLNSELTLDLAQKWAERLIAEYPGDKCRLVMAAYRAAYGRDVSDKEMELAERFLGEPVRGRLATEEVVDFCHAIFNTNEFISVD